MSRKMLVIIVVLVAALVAVIPAFADGPNFGEAIYADGHAWGTKGLGDLPAPNGSNNQSFDMLFVFDETAPEGQLPVSEAGPGTPTTMAGAGTCSTPAGPSKLLSTMAAICQSSNPTTSC